MSAPAPALPLLIHDDPIFGLHAHTTPGQTAAIAHAFRDADIDINIDDTRRLRRDAHDLVIFRFETLEDLLDKARGHLNLQPAPAPADAPAPAFHYPPNLVRLITLGDPKHDASKMPPDFYRQRDITPADIPALQRLFSDPEIIYMQDHGGYHTACWARSNALHALVELRAPGAVQLMLDDMRATEIAHGEDSFMEPNIEDDDALLPMLGPDACAPVITELQTHAHALPGHAIRMTEILSKLAKRHPHLRDTCRDAICQQLENHPVNDREYNGFLVSALIDLEATEAAPLIEQACAAGHVDDTICGDWEDVQVDLGLKDSLPAYIPAWMSKKRPLGDEYDDDDEVYDDDDDDDADDDDADFIPFSDSSETPIRRTAPKVGRNDPCPCGSGKKYKKCCMDKDA